MRTLGIRFFFSKLRFSFAVFALLAGSALASGAAPLRSAEVQPDGRIIFRYRDTGAKTVKVSLAGIADPIAMTQDAEGIWSATTPPQAPETYWYSFWVDDRLQLDPLNSAIAPNPVYLDNLVTVPSATPQPWSDTHVPHGELHHHFYTTGLVKGLPNDQSECLVYTPPGYDARKRKTYPVLYLLHGWSDSAVGWTAQGGANFILDNLVCEGKAKPMIVVMPLSYSSMAIVRADIGEKAFLPEMIENGNAFGEVLLKEIIPQVEAEYRVIPGRQGRAIAGLSMGGMESLSIGLKHPETFAWVGGFSSAVGFPDLDAEFPGLNAKKAKLKLLWIACGTEDSLIDPNRKFVAWLKAKNFPVTAVETPGMHTWMVWHQNLIHFAPLLFREK